MKATGIVRKIDELGRIVIPVELRRVFGIAEKDAVEIVTSNNKIVISKVENEVPGTSMVRKIDELGRLVLPIEIRRTFGIEEKDPLEIFVDGTSLIFCKYAPGCIECGSIDNQIVTSKKGLKICTSCLYQMVKEIPNHKHSA